MSDFDLNAAIGQSSNLIAAYIGASKANIAPSSTPPAPAGVVATGAPQTGNPPQPAGMGTGGYLLIGGGVLALILVIVLIRK